MDPETTSLLSRQPSGIRALPSNDDDDDDDESDDDYETNYDYNYYRNNSFNKFNKFNEKNTNLYDNNATTGSNDSNISSNTSLSSGNNGGFVEVEESEAFVDDPVEEMGGEMVGNPQNDVFETGPGLGSGSKVGVPVAKVSGEGDDDVGSGEDDEGSEIEEFYGVQRVVPRVRVLDEENDEEEEEGEEWGESLEGQELEGPIGDDVVDEADGDAVVDNINVDVVEAVRSGVAVVGVDDSKGSEAESVEVDFRTVDDIMVPSANEDDSVMDSTSVGALEERKDLDVVAREGAVAVESAPVDSVLPEAAGVNYTDEGDAVVDAINFDAAEAARSTVAVVGEVKGSGAVVGNSVVDDVAPEVEDSVAEKYASEDPTAIRTDEAKFVGEGDSFVDAIEVNVVEAIRSGVAVVGESESEGTEFETKDVVAPVVENVSLANEFSPLADPISSEVVERLDDELEEAQTNVAEAPRSIEIPELLNLEKTKSETDFVSKEREPSDELQYSGGENEKVELDNIMNDEPAIGPVSVGGEKAIPLSYASVLVDELDSTTFDKNQLEQSSADSEDGIYVAQEKGDDLGSGTDGEDGLMYYGSGSSSKMVAEELKTHDNSGMIDGQVVTDSEDADSDDGNKLFDSAALTALLKAATRGGTDSGSITVRSQDGSRLFSLERPAGLEPSLRSARPTTGPTNSGFFNPTNFAPPSEENLSEEDKKKLQNLQHLKVKFLRLAQKLGVTAEYSLAAQVLYKLTVFTGKTASPAFSLDNAKHTAMQLEAEGKDLDFSLNILVLGKSGVGKSAIINSIFGEEKVKINAFDSETTSVNKVCGNVGGVKIRFIDAPGLRSAAMEQGYNRKVLASVKKLTNKYPPDVMFYVDRLDSQTRDLNDLPLLKTISNSLGTSIWRNAIVTLTHASSAPPDGPSGTPLSYEVFVAQRSHIVQQLIGQVVGKMRLMNLNMMNPVSLVENHCACRKNREGQKILPNGQAWRPQLLLLCYSVKILSEANASSKTQDAFDPIMLFGFRSRSPPLPYLLSSLLQPRAHPKLSADQGGDNVDSDIDLDDVSYSDQEEEEYDQLPLFKPLMKSQMAKLSSDQKKAYFEEYDYRVKLLQRKQWREELKRMRDAKKSGNNGIGENPEDYDGENGAPAAVPVPLPDMTLPPSFDSDNPAYRYRFLEPTSQFLARPVLDPHGWDHDCGYEGVNVEHTMGIAERYPASLTVQVNKDKKDFNIHLDSAVSAKHGENGSSLLGFDVQTIGKQYAYIVRGESKFKNLKKNKTAAGVTVTFLGENVATGVKVENQIIVGKRLVLVGSTGTVRSQKDAAYGANLEVRLREADYPIGQEQSSFTLSLMKWRGDLAVGGNLQSQISVGRNSKMVVRAALNNKMSGQVTVRTSSSDHLSIALAGLMPIVVAIYQKLRFGDDSENYSIY